MNDDILEEQRELVALLESAGWDVTEAEISEYDSPWVDDTPEATITLTARKQFPRDDRDDGKKDDRDDRDDGNPYRVQD